MTRIGLRKADRFEARDGHAVEPLALDNLDLDEVMLLGLVEILDSVGVPTQLVLYLEACNSQVAVEIEDAEAVRRIPASAALPRVARVERVRPGWLGESVVGAAPADGAPVGHVLRRL